MNSSTATAMDQTGKYWGMWGASSSSSTSTASPISAWAAAYGGSSEPSWEEQAFARDAAAHLGGCVWPPRSYSCTFCQREFRSAQALGGHMNVHRRDRALLRQGGSSSPDDVHAPNDDQSHPQQGALLYRAAAASNPSTTTTPTTTTAAAGTTTAGSAAAMGQDGDANTTTPTSYLSTIIKESKNKLFMPIPDHSVAEMREDQAAIDDHQCDRHDDGDSVQSARKKRRRLDHPLAAAAALLIFVQPTAKAATDVSQEGRADHETKVPQMTTPTSPSSISPLLDQRQELDLELRLGTTPKVTYMAIHKAS
ncbi:zinc finger protein 10 [Sorghum bicolor]|uniref:C2H2-type domain-containing protein n=1 Tax=Sorghum bicolor TaxID=4558 RepID=C5Y1T7_SORBI|nr:zinc finger protein 10 [Sorghum bicolor]XP_021316699.1 zinc finger protein 10 [Sorghum bicolor]EES10318.1 hypothetical protein SORBI_3005G231700 [Sorghum bicolor]OQU84125.1 hypothetical protein SORBI_3005G231700 [Sorghum bicolor]|eukprot:XP_002451330.1 zinc finger protein 10 [Sorghum bicolor]